MGKRIDYPFEVRPLSAEEGGGFLISYPDFADCISDGETVEEALTNGKDALKSTIAALNAKRTACSGTKWRWRGVRKICCPCSENNSRKTYFSGQGRRRFPQYAGSLIHCRRARTE